MRPSIKHILSILFAGTVVLILVTTYGCFSRTDTQEETLESKQEDLLDAEDETAQKVSPDIDISDIEMALISFAAGINKSITIINTGSSSTAASIGESSNIPSISHNTTMDQKAVVIQVSFTIAENTPPASFFENIPSDGYINTPTGQECPFGAATYMMFSTSAGNNLTGDYLANLGAKVIPFDIMSLSPTDPGSIQSYINQKLTSNPQAYADPSRWNIDIWGTEGDGGVASLQEPVGSIIDYHFWSNSPDIESIIVNSVKSKLPSVAQVLDAFEKSDKISFLATPKPSSNDLITQKNIKAEFSGDVEGIIYETRELKLKLFGSPEFGPMHGEGEVTLKNTEEGDIHFKVELDWTAWEEMGAPTEGFAVLYNEELGYKIEINTNRDGTKDAVIFIDNNPSGELMISADGSISYTKSNTGETIEFGKIY